MAPPRPPHRGPSLIASTKEREFGAKSRRLGQKNRGGPEPLRFRASLLVAGTGFEPATFGLVGTIQPYCRGWREREPDRNARHQSAPCCTSRC